MAGEQSPARSAGTGAGRDAYVFARGEDERARLDVQHYAIRETMGANHRAPVDRPRPVVLDAGSGSGQWAYDACEDLGAALVVGLDLQPSTPPWPERYRFVRGSLLGGLPFPDDRFDFTHQRLLMSGIPVRSWTSVVADLVRVTRPGGWIELAEGAPWIDRAGPAAERLCDLLCQLARMRGLDSTGIVFRSLRRYLEGAGAEDVHEESVAVPIGPWGGRPGSLMATQYRAMFTRTSPAFTTRLGVSEQECRELVGSMTDEWDRHRSVYTMTVAWGRKPPTR